MSAWELHNKGVFAALKGGFAASLPAGRVAYSELVATRSLSAGMDAP